MILLRKDSTKSSPEDSNMVIHGGATWRCAVNQKDIEGKAQTVLGVIDGEQLGITSSHEHIIWDMSDYKYAGGSTIVELSQNGLARDPLALARIARATGLNIIMGSGYYVGLSHPEDM